jgi:ribosome biogenesis GTPase / thiamine phosphate phosphatase
MPTITETEQGTVLRKSLGHYVVKLDGREVSCSITNKLRKELIYPLADPSSRRVRVDDVRKIRMVDPVAIGDEVAFLDSGDGTGVIKAVLQRRKKLSRPAPGGNLEQVVVANVDQVVAVFAAAKPKPKWNLLDRYLASAQAAGIPALVCITKSDLAKDDSVLSEMGVYQNIGYQVVVTSAVTGDGIEEATALLKGKLSVLIGKSGVGKTTLLNAIQPDLGLRVNEVSVATDKGKHTTTHLEMFELDIGGAMVDTPGMREFGLWNVSPNDLAELFPEMHPYIGECRFAADCTHTHEPDCAIKQAVEAGQITERRYQSYLSLRRG